jgi:hypothetical protein
MSGAISGPETLYGKVLRNHIVDEKEDGTILLYIGKFLLNLQKKIATNIPPRSPPCARSHVSSKSKHHAASQELIPMPIAA